MWEVSQEGFPSRFPKAKIGVFFVKSNIGKPPRLGNLHNRMEPSTFNQGDFFAPPQPGFRGKIIIIIILELSWNRQSNYLRSIFKFPIILR